MNTKEVAFELTRLDIKNYKKAIEKAENLKAVINSFNGKVYNKRLSDELNKDGYKYRFDKNEYYLLVSYIVEENHVASPSEHGCAYTSHDTISLCHLNVNEALVDGKRINAEAINASIDNSISNLNKRIESLEQQLEVIDTLIEKRAELMTAIDSFNNSLTSEIDENFSLRIKASRW